MDPEKNTDLTPEEHTAEQEILTEAKEDEIREKIIADLGLSDDNDELVEKLVAREVDHRKRLSTAVRQKIDWRTKAASTPKQPAKPGQFDPEAIRKEAEAATMATLERRDLEEMDYSDTVKEEITKFAKLNNVSVRTAAKDSYIQFVIEKEQKQQRINEAADNGSRRSRTSIQYDTTKPLEPKDFDMSSEEGRAEWQAAKAARAAARS